MTKRIRYSLEYKQGVANLIRQSGTRCHPITYESDINLNAWESKAGNEKALQGTGNPRHKDVARLKRELPRTTRESIFFRDSAVHDLWWLR